MKLRLHHLALLLILPLMFGCVKTSSTTTPIALAPGYTSQADQTLGQSLAAVTAFRDQEKLRYTCQSTDQLAGKAPCLTDAQKATEKPYLNSLIEATNLANVTYVAFHSGTSTLAQAQSALAAAQNAQAGLLSSQGVK